MPIGHDRRFVWSLLIALTPACALVGGLPFVNRLEPRVFGLPFLMSWIVGWVVLTPVFLYLAYLVGGTNSAAAGARNDDSATQDDTPR